VAAAIGQLLIFVSSPSFFKRHLTVANLKVSTPNQYQEPQHSVIAKL
jgi:hypothetical protein